jgi:pheromone a factor receptor
MEEFLSSGHSISRPNYIRLMLIASVDIIFTVPTAIYLFYLNVFRSGHNLDWESWSEIHSHFSNVVQIPASDWKADRWGAAVVYWQKWVFAYTAVVYFAFFGFTKEMREMYWRICSPVAKLLGCVRAKDRRERKSAIIFKSGNVNSAAPK